MGRPYTVLVVDDDDAVRGAIRQVLSREGFFVVTARNGYEALCVLMEHHVDLLLADLVMPGISGFEFTKQAKVIRPRIKVLYISGQASQAARADGPREGRVLPKPLRANALVSEIRSELSGIP